MDSKDNVIEHRKMGLGFKHKGSIVMSLAQAYGRVELAINELAQNQIDAKASKGEITLDLSKNRIFTFDNGKGASYEEMERRMAQIGSPLKGPGDIGEKGLGNLAPISIAKRIRFVTHAKGTQEPFFMIKMDKDIHVVGKEDVDFDVDIMGPGFKLGEGGWTTSVSVSGVEESALRALKKEQDILGFLCDSIASAYREKIRVTGIQLTVRLLDDKGAISERRVVPLKYPGRHEFVEITTKSGPVIFELFLTNRKQKNPRVDIEYQKRYSFSLKNLDAIWDLSSYVFGSGFIQGSIHIEFGTLTKDRKQLEWGPEVEDLEEAILKFCLDYGETWIKKLEDVKKMDLFEKVARAVLSSAEKIIKENPELLSEIFKGSVSDGHGGSTKPLHEEKKIRTRIEQRKPSDVPSIKGDEEAKPAPSSSPKGKRGKEKKSLHPGVVSDSGSKRRALKGQYGLQIIDGDGPRTGWRAKIGIEGEEAGKIVINVQHRDYASSQDKGPTAFDTYMRLLIMVILSKPLILSEERAEIFHKEFEDVFMEFKEMITPLIPKSA